jgi:hypothetical protein
MLTKTEMRHQITEGPFRDECRNTTYLLWVSSQGFRLTSGFLEVGEVGCGGGDVII